ncbi:MAG: peptidase S41, partial [Muribaculaceae bacterium]|nr:peptidase S41 [Muribaculaceae bacterium]
MNVYRGNVTGGEPVQLTEFKNHPVRHLSATADGSLLAFSWNGEIYSLAPGGRPKKVDVNIVTDDYEYVPATGFDKRGVTDYALSPDEKTIAFIVDGDVYLTSVEYGTTRRVTDTPAQERSVSWVKDGRSIVYDSDRDGLWQLFTSEIKNDDEKSMLYATELVEKPLYKSAKGKPAFFPVVSPDGKQVAFLEDRTELKVIDLKSKKVNTALDGKYNYSYSDGDVRYSWSPDSRWLLCDYIGVGGWNNSDIALVKADGSEVVDLTESGYSDSNATWALDGKAVIWQTGKYGYKSQGSWGNQSDAMIMFLDGDAYDRFNMTKEERELADKGKDDADKKDDAKKDDKKGAKKGGSDKDKKENAKKDESVKPLEFDLENRRYRKARLTPSSSRMGAYYL